MHMASPAKLRVYVELDQFAGEEIILPAYLLRPSSSSFIAANPTALARGPVAGDGLVHRLMLPICLDREMYSLA